MRYLKPLIFKENYYKEIEKKINAFFYEVIFAPILKILKQNNYNLKLNSKDIVADAILSHKIRYDGNGFTGAFTAQISKELLARGAVFNKTKKSWIIPKKQLSANSLMAIAQIEIELSKITLDVTTALNNIDVNEVIKKLDLTPEFEKTLTKIDNDYKEIARSITIKPEFTPEQRRRLAEEYNYNLKLPIKNFTQDKIIKLRDKVQQNVFSGLRASNLVKTIESENNTSRAKAKFLARQETSLLTSKMREIRFSDGGVTKYKWSGAMDERERSDHKRLENKIFSWDNPPITNLKTGARNNPGEDYGCRCLAIPMVE